MPQTMMLKITLDRSLDAEAYDEVGANDEALYVVVKSASEKTGSKHFTIEHCPLEIDGFEAFPKSAILSIYRDRRGALLWCQWEKKNADSCDYICLTVKVEVVTEFPSIEFS